MMSNINTKKLKLIVLIGAGCFVIGTSLISLQKNYQNVQRLKDSGIYELSFSYVQNEKRTEIYYMVCDPPNERQDIQEMIDVFLADKQIVEELKVRSVKRTEELTCIQGEQQLLVGMNLVFLSPSKDLTVGEFPDDIYNSKYRVGEHRLLTISISITDDNEYDVAYLWPR